MSETFSQLVDASLNVLDIKKEEIIQAEVKSIDKVNVELDAGLKSVAYVPVEEFYDMENNLEISVNDHIGVVVITLDDGFGNTILSRAKAKRKEKWTYLEKIEKTGERVQGIVLNKVRSGYQVELGGFKAFLPGSLADTRPAREIEGLEGQKLEFKVLKVDNETNNVLLSRKEILEEENSEEREKLLERVYEGAILDGTVKNMTRYGAFIDLNGIDGLLHITDISWSRIKDPADVLELGQEIKVKVLSFDTKTNRVSLSLKQLTENPWKNIDNKYQKGMKVKAKVASITDYGCFAELEPGIEGLVHVSEMDWTNKNINAHKKVKLGEEIEVMILDIDIENRRVSLGMKQCVLNPWEEFNKSYKVGDKIKGIVRSITDFGLFIGLDNGIDGLVHNSDISWESSGEKTLRLYKKTDEIEIVVLAVDVENERISLGIKQLYEDEFAKYCEENPTGSEVKGKITDINSRNIIIELASKVTTQIKKVNLGSLADSFNIDEDIDVKISSIDTNKRMIFVTLANGLGGEQKAPAKLKVEKSTTIGDLIQKAKKDQS